MRGRIVVSLSALLLTSVAWGQNQPSPTETQPSAQQAMPGMNMPGDDASNSDMSNMKGMSTGDKEADSNASLHAMNSMEGHMDMGPHMKMTALRPAKPGDAERAEKIVAAAREVGEQYLDYHVALADGFKIFHPELPQKVYHFTNYRYGLEAAFHFNPEHPTSLLYEKHGDGYKLVGVMYTAPRRFTEDQLDERIPLSIAQWHQHVNFCVAPPGHRSEYFGPHALFGLGGSISTQEACDAAGGYFIPVVLNWMVHVYPFEKDQASIWSVERQHAD
ncbi:MAG TPA: hypothetical protein VMU61_05060 [Candidatus Aquilonibacter sp.]|nr:hypothetical protein [Candidatus Aquilonibacter sp.]